ncbi:MAG: hypothetical protein ACPGUD_09725 [Parashewanella sp.]
MAAPAAGTHAVTFSSVYDESNASDFRLTNAEHMAIDKIMPRTHGEYETPNVTYKVKVIAGSTTKVVSFTHKMVFMREAKDLTSEPFKIYFHEDDASKYGKSYYLAQNIQTSYNEWYKGQNPSALQLALNEQRSTMNISGSSSRYTMKKIQGREAYLSLNKAQEIQKGAKK